jgi:hypothetical protein
MIEGQDMIGMVSMDLLDKIEREYGEERNPVIRQCLTALEIEFDDDDGDRSSRILHDFSEPRPVVRAGLYVYLGQVMGID